LADSPYSPGSLGSERAANATAREFAQLVGRVVNTTVSAAPITFVEVEDEEPLGYIAHCERKVRPVPLPLSNGYYLFLFHLLGVRPRGEDSYLTTLEYRYVYQASLDDRSWIFRYEYAREPEPNYPYPLCHVHVNASPEGYSGDKEFPDLHLPAGDRVTIESVVRHLMVEHGFEGISPDWESVLEGAENAFREIQRKRIAAD
jgi:hypothetical protein